MSTTSSNKPPVDLTAIQQAHQLYGQLTAQTLRLAFDRERMWYELLSAGYTLQDLRAVITYLQREIRAQRRNVGALKLSNHAETRNTRKPVHALRIIRPPLPSSRSGQRALIRQ